MAHRDRLIEGSRLAIRALIWANRLLLVALVVGLILSWVFPQLVNILLRAPPGADVAWSRTGVRLLVLVGVAGCLATVRLFELLAQIVATVGVGDPFIAANARRLQGIGWCLLTLQLLDIPAALIGRFFPALGSTTCDSFSIGGWISVLMVFILSRVFAAGSAMREELEGTV